MYVKIHKSYRVVVAICDSDLIGKRFEENIKQLDVRESFFKGEEKSDSETLKIMEEARTEDATFNIVGEKSCKLALKCGIIAEHGIKRVQGVPFALVLL